VQASGVFRESVEIAGSLNGDGIDIALDEVNEGATVTMWLGKSKFILTTKCFG